MKESMDKGLLDEIQDDGLPMGGPDDQIKK